MLHVRQLHSHNLIPQDSRGDIPRSDGHIILSEQRHKWEIRAFIDFTTTSNYGRCLV